MTVTRCLRHRCWVNMFIDDGEQLVLEGEDLQSCFNLFFLPPCWKGFIAFSMPVSGFAFGLESADEVFVGLRAVPMGWINSVDLIQNFIRRFVFNLIRVPASMEMGPKTKMPEGDIAVVCMDGFDLVRKIARSTEVAVGSKRHKYMRRFIQACEAWKLPRNVGKSVLQASEGVILGATCPETPDGSAKPTRNQVGC